MNKLGILFLMSLLVVGAVAVPAAVSANTFDAQQAERMLDLADEARVRVDAIFEMAQEKNLTVTASSTTARSAGDALLAQARAAYGAGNYTQSMQLAFDALHQYSAAVGPLLTSQGEDSLDVATVRTRLEEAIRRHEEFLLRVRHTLERAQTAGFDVASIENRLSIAEGHLNNATSLLNQGDVDGAAQEIGKVRSSFAGVNDDLQHLAKEQNRKRLGNFANGMENQLSSLERAIGRAEERGIDVTDARAILEEARLALEEAKSLAAQGDIHEATMKMKEARKDVQDVLKDVSHQWGKRGGGEGGPHSLQLDNVPSGIWQDQ